MIFRMLLAFVVLTGSISGLLYLATYTDYFDRARMRRLARNALILAAGGLIAATCLTILIALTS